MGEEIVEKLLSVVIPAYNAEAFLDRCLQSLLQTEQRELTELWIVNDGSTDKTGELAENYEREYPGIVSVIHKENGGHGSAVNAGIKHATATYFKVVDSDDWVEPEAYDQFLSRLKETDCDLVATPFTCVKVGQTQRRQIEGSQSLERGQIYRFEDVADNLHVRMHEYTIKTEILQEHHIELTEHSFYVDMQYILFPVPWIRTICFFDLYVYCYRLGEEGQSVSVKNMQKNRNQHQNVIHSLTEFYHQREQAGDSKAVLRYLAKGIAKMQSNQVQIILSLPIGNAAKTELIEAEDSLKKNCPAAYQANEKQSLRLLRKSRYLLYRVAAVTWRIVKR